MLATKRDPMSADLLRQRRNLLITSLTLIAINLAGATLNRDVSVLGASIEFSNPERVVWGAWILWGYFLIRYWQYLNEEPDLGLHRGMTLWILARFPKHEDSATSNHIDWQYGVLWTLYHQDHDCGDDTRYRSKQNPQSSWKKAIWTLCAFISVAAKTPRFTDYVVPFLVAAIPLLLSISSFRLG